MSDKSFRQALGDRPIATAAEDRLNRGPFVQALARQITETSPKDSAVFALYGPWGSGKTSILNLVEETLTKQDKTVTLRFNPWLFSGTEQLVGHFFRDLAAQLVEKDSRKYQAIAKYLETYGLLVGPFGTLPLIGPWLKASTGLSQLLGDITKWKAKTLPGAGSVESQRKHLVTTLSSLDKHLVVLIDDIDRLRQEEIRDIMRLIRLIADFPNTQYLLAFDRARVVAALAGTEGDGQAYLEKIVQAAFEVPRIAEPDLTEILTEAVNNVLQDKDLPSTEEDLTNIFHQVIRPLFSTAREVRRYVNCLPLAFDVMGEEIASPDLLAVEALRTIHPEIIERFPEIFDVLTAVSSLHDRRNREESQITKATIDKTIQLGGHHAGAVRELLDRVFPPTRRFTANYFYGPEWQKTWRRERRLANPEVLRFYLEKSLPQGTLPTPRIRQIFTALGDAPRLSALLEPLRGYFGRKWNQVMMPRAKWSMAR